MNVAYGCIGIVTWPLDTCHIGWSPGPPYSLHLSLMLYLSTAPALVPPSFSCTSLLSTLSCSSSSVFLLPKSAISRSLSSSCWFTRPSCLSFSWIAWSFSWITRFFSRFTCRLSHSIAAVFVDFVAEAVDSVADFPLYIVSSVAVLFLL